MADPNLPGTQRVQAIFPSVTGLPEDVIINSWAFQRDQTWTEANRTAVADALTTFYGGLTNSGFRPGGLVTNQIFYKFYDLAEDLPRTPTELSRTLAVGGSTPAVEEMAICLSWYAQKNTPRRRGRVFLGPWGNPVVTITGGHTRIASAVRVAITSAFNQMQMTLKGSTIYHGHVSNPLNEDGTPKTSGAFYESTHCWVDDAFDTQRRRGPVTTARTLIELSQTAG